MLLLFGIEEKRGWLPFTGMSGGGGGFGVDDEEEDEVNEEWTKLELGTGKPGLGEAPKSFKKRSIIKLVFKKKECISSRQPLKYKNGTQNKNRFLVYFYPGKNRNWRCNCYLCYFWSADYCRVPRRLEVIGCWNRLSDSSPHSRMNRGAAFIKINRS